MQIACACEPGSAIRLWFSTRLSASCVADNSLGRAKKYMEVSGRPGPAEFHSAPWSRSQDSYNLTWKVDSYPPLQEVRLLYRKLMVSVSSSLRWCAHIVLAPRPLTPRIAFAR